MADKNGRECEQAALGTDQAADVIVWEAGWLAWPGR